MKQFVVIGCGRFGSAIAMKLTELGKEVMVVDVNEEKLNSISNCVTHTVVADVTIDGILHEIGVQNFDCCIIATASSYQASIITALSAKELGIKVIAKARDKIHEKVLLKLGVDKTIIPERDMGIRMAYNLTSSDILDYIELSEDFSLLEIKPDINWIDKIISDLKVREKYGINIVAIKNDMKTEINPGPDYRINENDTLLVIGKNKDINMLKNS